MTADRRAIAALALSASALVALVAQEGYSDRAIIPVKGDVPTLGHGSTTHADGTPVRMGDTTTPVKALYRAMADIQKFEGALKQCVKVPLHQHEYDAFISLSYNIGSKAFCGSTVVRRLNSGDYTGACDAILMWDKVGTKVIRGLQIRREHERVICLGQVP